MSVKTTFASLFPVPSFHAQLVNQVSVSLRKSHVLSTELAWHFHSKWEPKNVSQTSYHQAIGRAADLLYRPWGGQVGENHYPITQRAKKEARGEEASALNHRGLQGSGSGLRFWLDMQQPPFPWKLSMVVGHFLYKVKKRASGCSLSVRSLDHFFSLYSLQPRKNPKGLHLSFHCTWLHIKQENVVAFIRF